MRNFVERTIYNIFGVSPANIALLGGGFYGRAFKAELPQKPYEVVVKLYLFPGLARKEAEQLKLLGKYSRLPMPQVLNVTETDNDDGYDTVTMSYLHGINAGEINVAELAEAARNTICDEIVDNLLTWHNISNPQGFGWLNSGKYCATWQEFYFPVAQQILKKAERLHEKREISDFVLEVFRRSMEQFDRIFDHPITQSSLIHGDYNTWNMMLNQEKTHVAAVIDPFNCGFADNEYDLYQLDNVNGKAYGLLQNYAKKRGLSENFQKKRCFYELYTEVNHYYDSHVKVDRAAVERLAVSLGSYLIKED